MFAKIKSPIFIDVLTLELVAPIRSSLRAILRDEKGAECSRMEANVPKGDNTVTLERPQRPALRRIYPGAFPGGG